MKKTLHQVSADLEQQSIDIARRLIDLGDYDTAILALHAAEVQDRLIDKLHERGLADETMT